MKSSGHFYSLFHPFPPSYHTYPSSPLISHTYLPTYILQRKRTESETSREGCASWCFQNSKWSDQIIAFVRYTAFLHTTSSVASFLLLYSSFAYPSLSDRPQASGFMSDSIPMTPPPSESRRESFQPLLSASPPPLFYDGTTSPSTPNYKYGDSSTFGPDRRLSGFELRGVALERARQRGSIAPQTLTPSYRPVPFTSWFSVLLLFVMVLYAMTCEVLLYYSNENHGFDVSSLQQDLGTSAHYLWTTLPVALVAATVVAPWEFYSWVSSSVLFRISFTYTLYLSAVGESVSALYGSFGRAGYRRVIALAQLHFGFKLVDLVPSSQTGPDAIEFLLDRAMRLTFLVLQRHYLTLLATLCKLVN